MAKQLFFGKTRITPFLVICINCSRIHSFNFFICFFFFISLAHLRQHQGVEFSPKFPCHALMNKIHFKFIYFHLNILLVLITMKIAKIFVEESHVALLEYIWMGHIPQSSFPIVASVSVKFCTRKDQFECP